MPLKCPICSNKPQSQNQTEDMFDLKCSYCGNFSITNKALELLNNEHLINHRLISTISKWLKKNSETKIDETKLKQLLGMKPDPIYLTEIEMLRWLYSKTSFPGERIDFYLSDPDLLSNCHLQNENEAIYFLISLLDKKLIQIHGDKKFRNSLTGKTITISPKGYSYLEELDKHINSNIGFCAMWFDSETQAAWEEAIKPALITTGYEAKRIDKHEHNGGFFDEIKSLIRKSKFVIADFTGNRGGVYYEAGFADGLGLPVIYTCRKDHFDEMENAPNQAGVHTDLRHLNFILWNEDDLGEFKRRIVNRLEGTILI